MEETNKGEETPQINKGAEFVTPTLEEVKKDRVAYVDGVTREAINKFYEFSYAWLEIKYIEAKIDMRLQQLGRDIKGNTVGRILIKENFNGVKKSEKMMTTELNLDIAHYKRQIGFVESEKRYFREELKFSDKDITKLANGTFDIEGWKKKREKELNQSESYIG